MHHQYQGTIIIKDCDCNERSCCYCDVLHLLLSHWHGCPSIIYGYCVKSPRAALKPIRRVPHALAEPWLYLKSTIDLCGQAVANSVCGRIWAINGPTFISLGNGAEAYPYKPVNPPLDPRAGIDRQAVRDINHWTV
jgi:hypothetical protein